MSAAWKRSVGGSREDGVGIPLSVLVGRATALWLVGRDDLTVRQLGRKVQPGLAAVDGHHSVNDLEVADLSLRLRIVLTGYRPRVGAKVFVLGPTSFRLVEPDKPLGRLAGCVVVAAGCRDVACPLGAGVGNHSGRKRLAA